MGCGGVNRISNLEYLEKDLFKEARGAYYKKIRGIEADKKKDQLICVGKNSIFKEEIIESADESGSVKPWLNNIIAPSNMISNSNIYHDYKSLNKNLHNLERQKYSISKEVPYVQLKIEHVFGYRCHDVRNTLFFINDEEIVYIIGALGVIQNIFSKKQKIFGGLEYGEFSECHNDDVLCLDLFKGDITMIATGQRELKPTVHIWSPLDTSVCYCSFQLPNKAREVCCLSFNNNGTKIVAVGRDKMNSFYLFNIKDKKFEWISETSENIIFDIEWNNKGDCLCLVGNKTIIFAYTGIYKLKSVLFDENQPNKSYFTCVGFTQKEKWIIGDSSSYLSLWNYDENKIEFKINLNNGTIQAIRSSSFYNYIYASDSNCNVYILEEYTRLIKIVKKITLESNVKAIDVNTKGNLILGTLNGDILYKNIMKNEDSNNISSKVFKKLNYNDADKDILKNQNCVLVTQSHFDGEIKGLVIVDNNYFISSGEDNRIILWNISTKSCEAISCINNIVVGEIKEITKSEIPPNFTLNQQSSSLVYNSKYFHICISIKNGTMSVRESPFNLDTKIISDIAFPNNSYANNMKCSPDGEFLCCGNTDNKIYLYNVSNQYKLIKTISNENLVKSPVFQLDWDISSTYLQIVTNDNNYLYLNIKDEQGIVLDNEETRNIEWYTITCKFGFYVQGIFLGSTDPNYINTVSRSKSKKYIISGDDDKLLNIYNFPVISDSSKCKSY